jgi:small subunit ribosomal protein S6
MYIIRPDIDKAEYEQVTARYEQAIQENGGTVAEVEDWDICPFAYEIEGYDKGYYVLMKFVLDTEKLPALEERFKLDERVLRYQIVRQEEPAGVPSQTAA